MKRNSFADDYELRVGRWIKDVPYASCYTRVLGGDPYDLLSYQESLERYYVVTPDLATYDTTGPEPTLIEVPKGLPRSLFLIYDEKTVPRGAVMRVNGKEITSRSTKEYVIMRHNSLVYPDGKKETVFVLPPVGECMTRPGEDSESGGPEVKYPAVKYPYANLRYPISIGDVTYPNIMYVPQEQAEYALVKSTVMLSKSHSEYAVMSKSKRRTATSFKTGCTLISKHVKRVTEYLLGKQIQVRSLSKVADPRFVDARAEVQSSSLSSSKTLSVEASEIGIFLSNAYVDNLTRQDLRSHDLRSQDVPIDDSVQESAPETPYPSEPQFMINHDHIIDYSATYLSHTLGELRGKVEALLSSYSMTIPQIHAAFEDCMTQMRGIQSLSYRKGFAYALYVLRRVFSKYPFLCVAGVWYQESGTYFFSNSTKACVSTTISVGSDAGNGESENEVCAKFSKDIHFSSTDSSLNIIRWTPTQNFTTPFVLSHNLSETTNLIKALSGSLSSDEGWSFVILPKMDRSETQIETTSIESAPEQSYPFTYLSIISPLSREARIAQMFETLKSQGIHSSDPSSLIIERKWPEDYFACDMLSDFFSAEQRMRCKKASKEQSPFDYWNSLDSSERQRLSSLGTMAIDEHMYPWVCNSFNPTFYVRTLRYLFDGTDLSSVDVLDPSSGWGDRLLGALAAGVKSYVGFDPNPKLKDVYTNIVNTITAISPERPTKDVRVECATFHPDNEKLIQNQLFDIAFTSPPYYVLEEYEGSENDKKMTYAQWMTKVYTPYLDMIVRHVKEGGWIVLYIEDIRVKGIRYTFAEDTVSYLSGNPKVERCQDIGLLVRPNTKVRNAYVWHVRCPSRTSSVVSHASTPCTSIPSSIPSAPPKVITSTNFKDHGIRSFGKYASFFPKSTPYRNRVPYAATSIIDSSIYSTSPHDEVLSYGKWMKSVITPQLGDPATIEVTDACANIGGDTFGFLAMGFKLVNSVEVDSTTAEVLEKNVYDALGYPPTVCSVMCADYLTIRDGLSQDVLYIDAPWGGRGYKSAKTITGDDLFLSSRPLEETSLHTSLHSSLHNVVQHAAERNIRCIIVKVPNNFDDGRMEECLRNLGYTRSSHIVKRRVYNSSTGETTIRNAYLLIAYFLSHTSHTSQASLASEIDRRSYMITGHSGLDHNPLLKILGDAGFTEKKLGVDHECGVVICEQNYTYDYRTEDRYDRRVDSVRVCVKNVLGTAKRVITDKLSLYSKLSTRKADDLLAPSGDLDYFDKNSRGIFIFKPSSITAGGGNGIRVLKIETEQDYHDAVIVRQEILSKWKSGIWSKYISSPMLFEMKKTHVRFYFVVKSGCAPGDIAQHNAQHNAQQSQWSLFPKGRILYAKEPYALAEFDNKDIHDTHIETSRRCLFFPDDLGLCTLPDGSPLPSGSEDHIFSGVKRALSLSHALLVRAFSSSKDGWVYPEVTRGAYEIFGCDFMIDCSDPLNVKPILLEINDRISNKPSTGGENVAEIVTSGPNYDAIRSGRWIIDSHPAEVRHNLWRYSSFSRLLWEHTLNFAVFPILEDNPTTFLISGDNGIDHTPLRELLYSKGFSEVFIDSGNRSRKIGLIVHEKTLFQGDAKYDKRVYPLRSVIKSLLSDSKECITNKWSLYQNMKLHGGEYTVSTSLISHPSVPSSVPSNQVHLSLSSVPSSTFPVIVKPVSIPGFFVGGGDGVKVVTSQDDLTQHVSYLRDRFPSNPIIASRYITNPLTFSSKKMHFRMYCLIGCFPQLSQVSQVSVKLWHIGKILTAGKSYVRSNYEDESIHDTHIRSTEDDYYIDFSLLTSEYPSDIPTSMKRSIFSQMLKCVDTLEKIVKEAKVCPYEESESAYEVFGLDFMVDMDLANKFARSVILLEVNDNIGISHIREGAHHTEFSRKMWHFVYANTIGKAFPMIDILRARYRQTYLEHLSSFIPSVFPKYPLKTSMERVENVFDFFAERSWNVSEESSREDVEYVASSLCFTPLPVSDIDSELARNAKEYVKEITTRYRAVISLHNIRNVIEIGIRNPHLKTSLSSVTRGSASSASSASSSQNCDLVLLDIYDQPLSEEIVTQLDGVAQGSFLIIRGYNAIGFEDEKPFYDAFVQLSHCITECKHPRPSFSSLHSSSQSFSPRQPYLRAREEIISIIETATSFRLVYYDEKSSYNPRRKYTAILKK